MTLSMKLSIVACLSVASVKSGFGFTPCTLRQAVHPKFHSKQNLPSIFRNLPLSASSSDDISRKDNGSTTNEYDDFGDFSSNQLFSTDTDTNSPLLTSLQSRISQVQDQSMKLPLLIMDSMLPRQILQLRIQNPMLTSLLQHRLRMEVPTMGMPGMIRGGPQGMIPLTTGVVVEILEMEPVGEGSTNDATSRKNYIRIGGSGGGKLDNEAYYVTLRATQRFNITGEIENSPEGWTEARVEFLDSSSEEENELRTSEELSSSSEEQPRKDRLSLSRAINKSKQFTSPNVNMKDSSSLIDRWIQLAKENERSPGQIDVLLEQLGDIPPVEEPTERAFWVGALINPLPAMGVAMEIRPRLLVGTGAEDRVTVALDGIYRSIRHMEGLL